MVPLRLPSVAPLPLLALLFVFAGALHAADPKGPIVPKNPLDNLATVKWDNISLEDVATDLREKHKLDVTVDRQSIENEGLVTTNLKINLNFYGLTLRSIIWLGLDSYRLELIEKPDGPLITSRPVAEATYLDQEYDLKLLGPVGRDEKMVIDLVRGSVDAYWKESDSFGGALEVADGKLKVSQIPAVQAQIATLFRQVQRELATGKKPPLTVEEENERIIAERLAKPPTRKLAVTGEIPFNELAAKCGEAFGVPMWVHGEGIGEARVGFKQGVTPQIEGKTGEEILDSILGPLDLGYVIDHEVTLLTSKSRANAPNRLRVFNARGKGVKIKGNPEEIVRKIQESDEYGQWGDGGGAIHLAGSLIVVRQSPKVIKKIEALFGAK